MKRIRSVTRTFFVLATAFASLTMACNESSTEPSCGTYNGNTLYLGPQGGCYYINSSGNKTYVDRSNCDC